MGKSHVGDLWMSKVQGVVPTLLIGMLDMGISTYNFSAHKILTMVQFFVFFCFLKDGLSIY